MARDLFQDGFTTCRRAAMASLGWFTLTAVCVALSVARFPMADVPAFLLPHMAPFVAIIAFVGATFGREARALDRERAAALGLGTSITANVVGLVLSLCALGVLGLGYAAGMRAAGGLP